MICTYVYTFLLQVVLDDKEEKVYTLTAAQADEGEGTEHLKLRNVKGQGGVRVSTAVAVHLYPSMHSLVVMLARTLTRVFLLRCYGLKVFLKVIF